MKTLVTGATGFIGTALIQRLLADGHEVSALVRETSDTSALPPDRVHRAVGDLNDSASLREAVRGQDVVYHLAGTVSAGKSQAYFEAHVGGTRNLIEALRADEGVNTGLVFCSSQAAGGPSAAAPGRTEDDPAEPVSVYGRSKLKGEEIVREESGKRPIAVLRPCVVYGPRDTGFLPLFKAARFGCYPYPGFREFPISLIHVDDLVEALVLAANAMGKDPLLYYVSDGQAYDWNDVLDAIAIALKRRARPMKIPLSAVHLAAAFNSFKTRLGARPAYLNLDKWSEVRQAGWLCSPERLARDTGFAAKWSLEHGMGDTARWYTEAEWL